MKSNIKIALACIVFLTNISQSIGQDSSKELVKDKSYILNSQYQSGKTYNSQIDAALEIDVRMGDDDALSDNRIRTMIVALTTENGSNQDVPFKLRFTYFDESSSGELSDPESDIILDTSIAGANGNLDNGNLAIKNVCGVEPIYLDNIQNVLKPVFELANLHFPKEAMSVGDSFQNRFGVSYPIGGFGIVETKQDMVITLLSVEDDMAYLSIKTTVSGKFVFDGIVYPVVGSGTSQLTLDIQNQYFTSYDNNQTDIISFNSGGTDITVRSTEISSNKTLIR